jgi:hypothetical protein
MQLKRYLIIFQIIVFIAPLIAQRPYIMVDQFGYRPQDEKVAVLADPVEGFNASDSYSPGEVLEVRRTDDHVVVFSGQPEAWHNGEVQESSGDRGWWFDFTVVKDPGSYYIFDPSQQVSSYPFVIAEDVYNNLFIAACKMFYYNRCNYPKSLPWAEKDWNDQASHLGPQQDAEARFVKDKNNKATAKDMHGGWFDAGDYNKYVTFAFNPIHVLLTAYEHSPAVFTDQTGIPESGNGIPDILDELKWEIDWVKRMQDEDGGVYIKIGYIDYNVPSPPSADKRPRYYGPKCSSSSIAAASIFAHAALVYSKIPAFKNEAAELCRRAEAAWIWYNNNPKSENCDDQEIKSGDADMPVFQQEQLTVTAAIYLYALTNNQQYHQYIKNNVRKAREFNIPESAIFDPAQGDALLFYTQLPQASDSVNQIIFTQRIKDAANLSFLNYQLSDDLYRAFMPSYLYNWGSNNTRACIGHVNYDMYLYYLDTLNAKKYYQHAINQLHYFHGLNPLNLTYISNIKSLGAENCVMRMWGDWYSAYTPWADNPPPGYITGGPNKFYSGTNAILKNKAQPEQKMYLDFNNGPPEDSWTITEPAIYYQAAYIKLLSKFVASK